MVLLSVQKGQKRRLRTALRASGEAFTRCKRCPLPTWRARGLCSACVTLKKDDEGNWYISEEPIVSWDEREFKRGTRMRIRGL